MNEMSEVRKRQDAEAGWRNDLLVFSLCHSLEDRGHHG